MCQLVRYSGFRYLKYGMSTNFVFASSESSDETVHLRLVRCLPNFPELAAIFCNKVGCTVKLPSRKW